MEIEHISVSRFDIYQTCPQKYKYRYELKVTLDGPEPIYFAYGTIIHKIAEVYVQAKGQLLISEIASDVLNGKIPLDGQRIAPPLPMEYRNKISSHLRAIKYITDKLGYDGELEYAFDYDLDPPNKKYFSGKIDRLIIKDGHCWIIDYKTSKMNSFRKNANTISSDLQLKGYARIAQKMFGIDPKNIKAALFYLEGSRLVPVQFSEKSLDDAEKLLLNAYNEIKHYDPNTVVGHVGDHCKRCDYFNICPYVKG